MAKITNEVLLNRRWNYYVIRELWKINRRKSPELYAEFNVSKRKYTNLITGDTYAIPQMIDISRVMHDKTGVDAEVFTGDALLNVDGITEKEIKEYYNNLRVKEMLGKNLLKIDEIEKYIHELKGLTEEKKEAYCKNLLKNITWKVQEFKKKVLQKLKNLDYRICNDSNLCRIEHYIRTLQKYSDTTNIEYIINTFKKVNISELESAYKENKLQKYIDNLRTQYELAHSVKVYYDNK